MQMESAAIAVINLAYEIHKIAKEVEENNVMCLELATNVALVIQPVERLKATPLNTRLAAALETTHKLLKEIELYVKKYSQRTFTRNLKRLMWESRRAEVEGFIVKLNSCVTALSLTHQVEANVAATVAREAPLIVEEANKRYITERLSKLRRTVTGVDISQTGLSKYRLEYLRKDLAETQAVISDLRLPNPAKDVAEYHSQIAELSRLLDGLTAQSTLATLAADIRDLYQEPQEACVLLIDTDYNAENDRTAAVPGAKEIDICDLFINLAIVDKPTHERNVRNAISQTSQLYEHSDNTSMDDTFSKYAINILAQPRDISQHADFNFGTLYDDGAIFGEKTPLDISNLFNGSQSFSEALLVGKSGIGKTTLCRFLAYEWATNPKWQSFRFVFFIQLNELVALTPSENAKAGSIPHILYLYMLRKLGIREDQCEKVWADILGQQTDNRGVGGGILFILDGYDEVAGKSNPLCEALFKIRDAPNHGSIKIIITSRPHVHLRREKIDLIMEPIGFTKENIYAYINRYYAKIAGIADHALVSDALWAYLTQHERILQMCTVPINLELVCSIWRAEKKRFEKEDIAMSDLYEMFLFKLMCRFFKRSLNGTIAEKEIVSIATRALQSDIRSEVLKDKNCSDAVMYLEELAYRGFISGGVIISPTILSALQHRRADTVVLNFYNEIGLLKAIGNMNEPFREQYFVHLSFQEYLTARFFVRNIYDTVDECDFLDSSVTKNMVDNKYNPRYLQVWMFCAGLLRSYWPSKQISSTYVVESDSTRAKRLSAGTVAFFSFLLGKSRDLYGMYEIELLVRSGEEAKWTGSPVFVEMLMYLGEWVAGIKDCKLVNTIALLFMACPVAMANIVHGECVGLLDILIFVLPRKEKFVRSLLRVLRCTDIQSVKLLEHSMLNSPVATQFRVLCGVQCAPIWNSRILHACRQLILSDNILVKLSAWVLYKGRCRLSASQSPHVEAVLILNHVLFSLCLDVEFLRRSDKSLYLRNWLHTLSAYESNFPVWEIVLYFRPAWLERNMGIHTFSRRSVVLPNESTRMFVTTHFCLWALMTIVPSEANAVVRESLLVIVRFQYSYLDLHQKNVAEFYRTHVPDIRDTQSRTTRSTDLETEQRVTRVLTSHLETRSNSAITDANINPTTPENGGEHNLTQARGLDCLMENLCVGNEYDDIASALDELKHFYGDLSYRELHAITVSLLKLAGYHSRRRDVALVLPAYIVLYFPILLICFYAFGLYTIAPWCVLAGFVLLESAYYFLFHSSWQAEYKSGSCPPYRWLMCCTPAGAILLLLYTAANFLTRFYLCVVPTLPILMLCEDMIDNSELWPCCLNCFEGRCLPETLVNVPLQRRMDIIDKVDRILSQSNYFPALLANYPAWCPFNSTQRLVEILTQHISSYKTAIWLTEGSHNELNWYQGRIKHTFKVRNIRRLLTDLRTTQLQVKPFALTNKDNLAVDAEPKITGKKVSENQKYSKVEPNLPSRPPCSSDEDLERVFTQMWEESICHFANDFPTLEKKFLGEFNDIECQTITNVLHT